VWLTTPSPIENVQDGDVDLVVLYGHMLLWYLIVKRLLSKYQFWVNSVSRNREPDSSILNHCLASSNLLEHRWREIYSSEKKWRTSLYWSNYRVDSGEINM
jgi:hypothetical protein